MTLAQPSETPTVVDREGVCAKMRLPVHEVTYTTRVGIRDA
jgi:hypothetical protein